MAKTTTTFYCQNCGTSFAKWQGQCTSCNNWNTIAKEVTQKDSKKSWDIGNSSTKRRVAKPIKIADVQTSQEVRMKTTSKEFNRVLGGGIVPGSLTLLGGEPGIGKSTLLLQLALKLPFKTLYVSEKKVLSK